MSRPDVMRHAQDERVELAALLRALTPEQWQTMSLCPGWTVRDVAVHVVSYDELGPAALAAVLRGGLRVARTNAVAMYRYRDLDPTEVVELVTRCQHPRGLTAALHGGIALTDGTIHHQDIRRALDLPRDIPADRLRHVLDFALTAPTLPAKKNAAGLTLTATDMEWNTGSGPTVTGTGEALLMAIAGRPHSLPELTGDGLDNLRPRINSTG